MALPTTPRPKRKDFPPGPEGTRLYDAAGQAWRAGNSAVQSASAGYTTRRDSTGDDSNAPTGPTPIGPGDPVMPGGDGNKVTLPVNDPFTQGTPAPTPPAKPATPSGETTAQPGSNGNAAARNAGSTAIQNQPWYNQDDDYTADGGVDWNASEMPAAWVAEIRNFDPIYQRQMAAAYDSGDEAEFQRLRDEARMQAYSPARPSGTTATPPAGGGRVPPAGAPVYGAMPVTAGSNADDFDTIEIPDEWRDFIGRNWRRG